MKKLSKAQFNTVETLINEFMEEHTDERDQTIKQFKAWIEVNNFVNHLPQSLK